MFESFGGRKFFLTIVGAILMTIIPILYIKAGVDTQTTQIVIGAIAAGIGAFSAANVLADKYASPQADKDETTK